MYYLNKVLDTESVIIFMNENFTISFKENLENTEYKTYLEWVAEGNEPLPWPPAEEE